jgi:hypothetical protein
MFVIVRLNQVLTIAESFLNLVVSPGKTTSTKLYEASSQVRMRLISCPLFVSCTLAQPTPLFAILQITEETTNEKGKRT